MFYQQIVFSSKTPFVARNLLEKLSRQIEVMEKLSAVSDENTGNISSVVEGKPLRMTPPLMSMVSPLAHASAVSVHYFVGINSRKAFLGHRVGRCLHTSVVSLTPRFSLRTQTRHTAFSTGASTPEISVQTTPASPPRQFHGLFLLAWFCVGTYDQYCSHAMEPAKITLAVADCQVQDAPFPQTNKQTNRQTKNAPKLYGGNIEIQGFTGLSEDP